MVGNGREWLIDLGQGPVRTEERREEIAGKKWDEAQLGGDESSMVVPALSSHVPLFSRQALLPLQLLALYCLRRSSLIKSFHKEALVLKLEYEPCCEP